MLPLPVTLAPVEFLVGDGADSRPVDPSHERRLGDLEFSVKLFVDEAVESRYSVSQLGSQDMTESLGEVESSCLSKVVIADPLRVQTGMMSFLELEAGNRIVMGSVGDCTSRVGAGPDSRGQPTKWVIMGLAVVAVRRLLRLALEVVPVGGTEFGGPNFEKTQRRSLKQRVKGMLFSTLGR